MHLKIKLDKQGTKKLIGVMLSKYKDQEVIIQVDPTYSRSKQAVLNIYCKKIANELIQLGNNQASDLISQATGPMTGDVVRMYFRNEFLEGRSTTLLSSNEMTALIQAIETWSQENINLNLYSMHAHTAIKK